jgi:hypothetical protein
MDCTPIVNYNFYEKYGNKLSYSFEGNEVVDTFSSACRKLNMLDLYRTVIVDQLGTNSFSLKLKFEIKSSGILSMQLYLGLLPTLPSTSWNIKRLIMKIKSPLLLAKSVTSIFYKTLFEYKKYDLQSYPDLIVGSGEECLKIKNIDSAKMIWAHAMDYDLYLLAKKVDVGQSHIVFLDEDMLFHSDYDYINISSPVTVDKYYSSINSFFTKLEEITGKSVVIAAHPRSNYEVRPDYYSGRKIIKGKTAELIRDASLILFHATTSINFAVLWGKPALSLITHELKDSWLEPRIKCLANAIGSEVINIDNISLSERKINEWLKVDRVRYEEYRRKYIKKEETLDAPIWQIVSDYLNSIKELSGAKNV